MSLQERRKFRIQRLIVWRTKHQLPFSRQCHQPRRNTALIDPLPGREKLCDHLTTIGDQYAFAGPDFANVLAQTVLQFAKTNAFHGDNVAS